MSGGCGGHQGTLGSAGRSPHIKERRGEREVFRSISNGLRFSRCDTQSINCNLSPKLSVIQDHYRQFLKNRREQNKTNLAAIGISEEYGELEKVLDTIIE